MPENISRRKAITTIAVLAASAALGVTPIAEAKTVSYKINYKLRGGELTKGMPRAIKEGDYRLLSWIPDPKKKGYAFAGWYKDAKLKAKAKRVTGTPAISQRTVYAKWRPTTYKLSYDLNGGSFSGSIPSTYTIETKTFALPVPEKCENECFAGWRCSDGKLLHEVKKGSVGKKQLCAEWSSCWSEASEARAAEAAADNANGALTLLHFSDIHGSKANLQRIVDFMDKHPNTVHAALCTGDLVMYWSGNGMSFWDAVPGAERIITCIGNHDTLNSDNLDWGKKLSMAESAARYIDPYIDNWGTGIERNSNAIYYSRVFDSQGIRLVVLDCMLSGNEAAEQNRWFKSQLQYALDLSQGVITACHYPTTKASFINCSLTTSRELNKNVWAFKSCRATVQSFINNGGEFICYLTGHTHQDRVLFDPQAPHQIDFGISCASSDPRQAADDNLLRINGCFSQDLFNLVTIDRDTKHVTVRRVGADLDNSGSDRDSVTYNYETAAVVQ